MSPSPLDYLRHVLAEAEYLGGQVKRLSREQFLQDETANRAFVRSIEIIGEAVKQLPDDIRAKYPNVEWRPIAGMRDKVIHHYFGVDYDIVWDAAVSKVPVLREQVQDILKREGASGGGQAG